MTENVEILPALVDAPTDHAAKEALSEQVKAHPGLVLGGGLALGLLAGALLPRGAARKLARGAIATAALGGEAGLALARQARDGARTAAGEASSQMRALEEGAGEEGAGEEGAGEEGAGEGGRRLRRSAAVAAGSATSAGLDLARAALRLLGSLRR